MKKKYMSKNYDAFVDKKKKHETIRNKSTQIGSKNMHWGSVTKYMMSDNLQHADQ